MDTPICNFLEEYKNKHSIRFHMPGHKGKDCCEYDITEISGADDLYNADGIILKSEENAGKLFGADTFYSVEGSSLAIRAMLYLAVLYAKSRGEKTLIAAGRNVHKSFVTAAALIDFDITWISDNEQKNYLSCKITPKFMEEYLKKEKPTAVYITSPDYLGNILDISGISQVCRKNGVLLLVDNAHGAYLKFLPESMHPIDLGADACCDSAHKTLPALTGGAYLHISKNAPEIFSLKAKTALSLFASTSPSYLILASLDRLNKYINAVSFEKLTVKINDLKESIKSIGFELIGNEPAKITIAPKKYGYYGTELSEYLESNGIITEFADRDFTVLMPSVSNEESELEVLYNILSKLPRKKEIAEKPPEILLPNRKMTIREAMLCFDEEIPVEESCGRIISSISIGCPPAVPIIVSGEEINENIIACFEYYNLKKCFVVKE